MKTITALFKSPLRYPLRVPVSLTVSLFMVALLGGCSNPVQIRDSAVDVNASGSAGGKILVVGLTERRYRTHYEEAVVNALARRGYGAVASSHYLPVIKDLAIESRFVSMLKESEAASVLTLEAFDAAETSTGPWQEDYIPAVIFSRDYQHPRQMRAMIAAGALADRGPALEYRYESQFFSIEMGTLMWTAKTDPVPRGDPMDKLISHSAKALVKQLLNDGALASQD